MDKKYIDTLVSEILAIEQEEALQAGALGYMARALIQATMPHSRVDHHEFKRKNGAFKLTMLADSDIGLPYGSIPRLIISWITTEAIRTKQRELVLGETLSEFMSALDMIPSGGRWGSITRLKSQMKKLFSASISCTYDDGKNWSIRNVSPVEKADLWWDPQNPHQVAMWQSKLLLGESFFQEIIENPVPIDMRVLKVLRQSPMAIDIYCWLTYRMSYLRRITHIPWCALQVQFGANYKDTRQFKRRFTNQLKKVLLVYPDAKVRDETDSLVLYPGKPHIEKLNRNEITSNISMAKPNEKAEKKSNIIENIELERKYSEYKLDSVIEILENLHDESEKHKIFKDFENYLSRKQLFEIRTQIVQGKHTKQVKEELYLFINSHWHHLLEPIKSYKDFCKTISK